MGAGESNGFYDGRRWISHVTILYVRNLCYIVWWTPAFLRYLRRNCSLSHILRHLATGFQLSRLFKVVQLQVFMIVFKTFFSFFVKLYIAILFCDIRMSKFQNYKLEKRDWHSSNTHWSFSWINKYFDADFFHSIDWIRARDCILFELEEASNV